MKKKRVCIILGTRPEIIKMSPIIRLLEKKKNNYFILHTGQHYSYGLDNVFFKELNLPKPKYNLGVGSGSQAEETGKMLVRIEKVLRKEKPDIVLVEGDTNTVLAGALAAKKLNIKIGHVEAGLRSYDERMPEETNRTLTDHTSDYLFCPTKLEKTILVDEGIEKSKIFVTGNTIVDAVQYNIKLAKNKSNVLKKFKLAKGNYFLVTIHRAENTDSRKNLSMILKCMKKIYEKYKLPLIFPAHPRTVKMIKKDKLKLPDGLIVIDLQGYLEFLFLEQNAKLILTDSGGIQEEACILKIPCVTLRDSTERPETVTVGANILAHLNPKEVMRAVNKKLKQRRNWKNPFGDGKTSERILRIIK
ncbi:UDP-N-acetylglucosamine 2-epimerase (non-hydrolyzing) [Candidatus Woesearchaeota archaeon]|nr:UDP-N-acetylglucosamine 2-epimerase (non-hydrolyzing) [Candidatus Woesearchaeota archaeon]